jgi:hypothetical protein
MSLFQYLIVIVAFWVVWKVYWISSSSIQPCSLYINRISIRSVSPLHYLRWYLTDDRTWMG